MISMYQAAEIFQQHADDILRELSKTPEGYKVIAEVGNSGNWQGTRQVTRATTSEMARTGYGYAIYFYPQHDKTTADIDTAIKQWIGEWRKELREEMSEGEEEFETSDGRSMISPLKAAEIVEQHVDDILRVLSDTQEGNQVIAEVDADGTWRGARAVNENAYSAMARNREGYAIHFYPNLDKGYFDVLLAIDEWLDGWRDEMFFEETAWWEEDTDREAGKEGTR